MSTESNFDTNEEEPTPSNVAKKNKKLPLSSFYEKSKYELKVPRAWLILMTLRIVLNVFFQRGYIHPDEFFQGVEPISGDLFNCTDKMILRTWEFQFNKTSGQEPIRNMAVPYFFYGIPLLILKYFSSLGSVRDYTAYINNLSLSPPSNFNMISVHANTLIYYPRLFMTFYSLIIDISIYLICDLCDLDKSSILITFASSYITLVYFTRTFSNSIEAIMFTLLIYFILKSIKSQRVLNDKFLVATNDSFNDKQALSSLSSPSLKRNNISNGNTNNSKVAKIISSTTSAEVASALEGKLPNNIQPQSLTALKRLRLFDIYKYNNLSSQISVVMCVGIFNRPTFVIFSFVPLVYWLLHGLENCNHLAEWLRYLWRRCLSLIRVTVPLSFLFILFDTCYFYKITSVKIFQEIIMKQRKLIITPYNFFAYNSKADNLKEHGEHPFYQHFLNCFLLFGLNHLILLFIFLQFFLQILALIKNNSNSNETNVQLSQQELAKKPLLERVKIKIQRSKYYANLTELYKQLISNTFCFFLFSFLVPLIVFSLVSHKEPRFLIPLLIPICLLTSHSLFGIQSFSILRFFWISFNFVCLIVYGYAHQGGVVPALGHVQKMFSHVANLEMDQHVIFYHTYMPPRYLGKRVNFFFF
jgi:GPI mannosyltransferase 4